MVQKATSLARLGTRIPDRQRYFMERGVTLS
jgi:hypothetical protein